MKCAVVTTTTPDVLAALDGLCDRLLTELDGAPPHLVLAFFTPHHGGEVEPLRRKIMNRLSPRVLLGGPGAGIIGGDVEIEERSGLALWAAHWPGAELQSFRLELDDSGDEPALKGWPDSVPEGAGFLVLADPYTTPGDTLLEGFAERFPGAHVVGGMASGTAGPGQGLFFDEHGVHEDGALGLAVGGAVRLQPIVSQGCRPIGRHFVITKAHQNVIFALGGKSALSQLRTVFGEVQPRDRDLMQKALHVGRAIDERKSRFERGDFLARNVLKIDQQKEALAINDFVRAGQTIQFMVRDSASASEDLAALLGAEAQQAQAGGAAAATLGALLFSCNGRGSDFFGRPNHDLGEVHRVFPDLPTAGFFANGEIGSVGGQPFLHGYTASIALFRRTASG
ncbi:MAG: FIST signal transduction protein [Planctomycetota bacterium]